MDVIRWISEFEKKNYGWMIVHPWIIQAGPYVTQWYKTSHQLWYTSHRLYSRTLAVHIGLVYDKLLGYNCIRNLVKKKDRINRQLRSVLLGHLSELVLDLCMEIIQLLFDIVLSL